MGTNVVKPSPHADSRGIRGTVYLIASVLKETWIESPVDTGREIDAIRWTQSVGKGSPMLDKLKRIDTSNWS